MVEGPDPIEFTVDAYNFDEESPTRGVVEVRAPRGWHVVEGRRELRIDPMGRARFTCQLWPAGDALGGRQSNFGDVSVELDVFPRVGAIVVIHRGDEEFSPEAGMLFKDDIINYLPLEDIAVTAGLIAGRLIEAGKKLP